MSATESKTKALRKARTTKKAIVAGDAAAALKMALDAAPIEYVSVSSLVISDQNARTVPYSADSVRGLADCIAALGLLQNLVVHDAPDGKNGVAGGGRRTTALQLLLSETRIGPDAVVPVKRIPVELAAAVSMAENEHQVTMHPADQVSGFRTMSAQGKTSAEIGALLGFSARHVQRMLKLAGLAPELIGLLAQDKISVEQCQALALDADPARQMQVWEQGQAHFGGRPAPAHWLKSEITNNRLTTGGNNAFAFVGREAYEAAGGQVEEDLFSEQDGNSFADRLLVEQLAQEKLTALGTELQQKEGWSWMLVRPAPVKWYGDDARDYLVRDVPDAVMTDAEQARLDELQEALEATTTHDDENAIAQEIEDLEAG